ncbi:MAG: lysophospholipid acyltransferase family protein, partial [Acidimicrobiales bacterium]
MAVSRPNSGEARRTSLSRSRRPPSLRRLVGRAGFPWVAPTWPTAVDRPAEHRLGVDYDTEWARRYGARLGRAVLLDDLARPVLHALARPTVTGLDRIADLRPPVVLAANHESHLDTALVLVSLPLHLRHRTVVAGAADYFFDRAWKAAFWAAAVAAVPVERHKVNRRSTELPARLLEEGWNLLIFPEGGRSPDGWTREFRGGAAYLARRAGCPVVPVHLEGTGAVLGKRRPGLRRGRTRVSFGAPIRPTQDDDLRRLAGRIESAVAALADEAATDWWTARQRAAAG